MDDDFFEIGGDSLQATEMLLEVEETTHHRISPSDIRAQLTIRVLCDRLAGAAAARDEAMTKVRAGRGTPLFLCHGDFLRLGLSMAFGLSEMLDGNGLRLSAALAARRHQGHRDDRGHGSRYIAGVQAAAPDGPIRVAGYCHGGLAALELVRRLEAAGRTVEKVVLIDTFSLNARPALRPIVPAVSWLGRWLPGGLGGKLSRSGMPSVWVLASHLLRRDPTILHPGDQDRAQRIDARLGCIAAHDLLPRHVEVPCRRSIQAEIVCLLSEEYVGRKEYEAAPWKRLAPHVQSGPSSLASTTPASARMSVSSLNG
jgi:hypothetical protein